MRHSVLIVLLVGLASACMVPGFLTGKPELRPEGDALYVSLSSNSPAGSYSLETVDGLVIGRGSYSSGSRQQQRGRYPGYRAAGPGVSIRFDSRRDPDASGCLLIRQPDGQLLDLGASGRKSFQLPALEAANLRAFTIRELQQAERDYDRNQRIVAQSKRWIEANPGLLSSEQTCRLPREVVSACSSESTLRPARAACFQGNFSCAIAGASVDAWVSSAVGASERAATMANYLSSNACSLASDSSQGRSTDLFTFLRSLAVSVSVDAIYRGLVNENPGIAESYLLAGLAGALNYELCVNDTINECRNATSRRARFEESQHRACVNRMRDYRSATTMLGKYGSPSDIQQALKASQARLRKLTSVNFFRRTPLVRQVRACSSPPTAALQRSPGSTTRGIERATPPPQSREPVGSRRRQDTQPTGAALDVRTQAGKLLARGRACEAMKELESCRESRSCDDMIQLAREECAVERRAP